MTVARAGTEMIGIAEGRTVTIMTMTMTTVMATTMTMTMTTIITTTRSVTVVER
jgi:hypothetical protein